MSATGPRDRYYSAPPSVHNVGMQYGWSALATQTGSANTVSGNWTPLQLDSSGNLSVTLAGSSSSAGGLVIQGGNTIPVFVSGSLNFTGQITTNATGVFTPDNSAVVAAVGSGNAYLASISGKIANGIAITGGGGTNPMGVTGTDIDLAANYSTNPLAPYNFLSIGGRVTNPSGEGSVTGAYGTGAYVMLNFAPNGAPYFNQGQLESGYDSVSVVGIVGVQNVGGQPLNVTGIILTQVTGAVSANFDATSIVLAQVSGNNLAVTTNALLSGVSGQLAANLTDPVNVTGLVMTIVNATATGPVGGVSGLAPQFFGTPLPANPLRKSWGIQVISTGALLVSMSASIPTTGSLDFVLKGATAAYAGDGGIYIDNPATYLGPVSVTGFGGAPVVYRAWQI